MWSVTHCVGIEGDKLAHLLPGGYLGIVPDSGRVGHSGGLGRDESCLGDEERAGDGGPLPVVLEDKVSWDVPIVVPEAGEGCKNDTMPELHVADLKGGEKGRSETSGHPMITDEVESVLRSW